MNSNLLFFLQSIQETGSISETARQLYVTQPYVSRIIKEAEKKYDVTLLVREHHPITLTIAGRKLLEYLLLSATSKEYATRNGCLNQTSN